MIMARFPIAVVLFFTVASCLIDIKDRQFLKLPYPSLKRFKNFCNMKGDYSKYKSPISIPTRKVVRVKIPKIQITPNHWSCNNGFELLNTGYYADFRHNGKNNLSISGGPLCATYKMFGFHFHWSDAENNGAEHAIDNQKYAGETHLVYYNNKYKSLEEALRSKNGVAVLGFFLKTVKGPKNARFQNLTEPVKQVQVEPAKVDVSNVCLDVFRKVAESGRYYHYFGSLTALRGDPALWLVFKTPVLITNDQLTVFRNMKSISGKHLSNIYPLQPLNGRTLYEAR